MATSSLTFENWTEVLGSERLAHATLDRLLIAARLLRRREKVTDFRTPRSVLESERPERKCVSRRSEADMDINHVWLFSTSVYARQFNQSDAKLYDSLIVQFSSELVHTDPDRTR